MANNLNKIKRPMIIDTHCHLDFDAFRSQLAQLVATLNNLSVRKVVVPGVEAGNWQRITALKERYPHLIVPCYGLHPCFTEYHQDESLDQLASACENGQAVGVGEIGLDFFIPNADTDRQIYLFKEQVKIAKRYDLPIIVHCRKAHDQCLKIIREQNFQRGGFIHAYSGSLEQAQRYIAYGFKLGVGGAATYDRARKIHRLLRTLPLSSFVLETDAPDIPPSFARNEQNSPKNLPQIASIIADKAGESLEKLSHITTINALTTLGLSY